ncbi:MAG TPA: helix-turn-helix domain-containing protein [Dehalococcoidia bacterium]|nr:helix-turn-helix domain-containing protein [Dehalococcoidia bacterium]
MLFEHLTLLEAARYLGVSRAKLSRLARDGLIRIHRSPLDRRVKLFRLDDLDDLLSRPRRRYAAARRERPAQKV